LAASLAIAAVTVGPSGGSPAQAAAGSWTGARGAAPRSGGPAFNQQTVRQIVHTSIGGGAARIQLSTVFGTQPVTIADVHVAQRTSGSSVPTGTDRQVTFGGATSTTIRAGGTAVSGSVGFTVAVASDVAVSFNLPQPTSARHVPQTGEQTNYISSGDVSANASLADANGRYVCAENAGASALTANRTVVGPWEEFDLIQD
jgi:hypothetical protein